MTRGERKCVASRVHSQPIRNGMTHDKRWASDQAGRTRWRVPATTLAARRKGQKRATARMHSRAKYVARETADSILRRVSDDAVTVVCKSAHTKPRG
eukprot:scaffold152634_cov31-Tisochrysis_lutea.AAC.2